MDEVLPIDVHSAGDDGALLAALADAGVSIAPDQLDALIAGVAAAPDAHDPDVWLRMLVEEPSASLRAALSARLAQVGRPSAPPLPEETGQRLALLRAELAQRGLAGFVVPRQDEHQGEYVPACAERLAWLSGFTGSAGTAVVLAERAALFVDGRYLVQAAAEVDPILWVVRHGTQEPLADWLPGMRAGSIIGYDPWLHTPRQVAGLRTACEAAGIRAEPVADNPVDAVWAHRPPPPLAPVVPHVAPGSTDATRAKRERIVSALQQANEHAAFLTQPDSIAWLLDIRGADVPFTPVTLAFAIVTADGNVDLFIDGRKLPVPAREHLLRINATVRPAAELAPALDTLGAAGRRVRIDPEATPEWVVRRLATAGAVVREGTDPCALPKACKSVSELAGIRSAHVRDGVALCRFLAWLATAAGSGTLTEIAAAEQLEQFRRQEPLYRGASFHTISAAAGNGAIVHYRATPATNRTLDRGSLYLVDSGGQYPDGTTDVTRTVAIGTPSAEMRERFTLVLKGHIAVATASFPRGTSGSQLDVLARSPLWRAGLDYDHGTGHGVGCYLSVHEGPQRISKVPNRVALEPGMVLSDEPGYYKAGAYGIRIENLLAVVALGVPERGEHDLLGFETLTLAPIDPALIDWHRLSRGEIDWLRKYHARVRAEIAPLVDAATKQWLEAVTTRLGDGADR